MMEDSLKVGRTILTEGKEFGASREGDWVELEDKLKHRIDREKEWLVRISNLELLARSWIL